jgi:hypothetical protein
VNRTNDNIFSFPIKVNPWKKPEPAAAPVAIQTADPPAALAPEKSPSKPAAKKAEKNPPSSSSSAMAKKDVAMEGEAASAAAETAEKKPEVRRLPPAPKTNPWKKPVPLVKEKEETDQPKVRT